MPASREQLENLVKFPRESLSVELKRWIDPTTPEGQAKIVRAAMALRNQDGGFLLIGFDDQTRLPSTINRPADPVHLWNGDDLQRLIARYASDPFELLVSFVERDGLPHPVVEIPAGIRTAVAISRDLLDPTNPGVPLIRKNAVFVRTLASNSTPSTSLASAKDWPDLFDRCFQNREADIGGFLRRHLAGIDAVATLRAALGGPDVIEPQESSRAEAIGFLQESHHGFLAAMSARQLGEPEGGSWEVAAIVRGQAEQRQPSIEFLTLLDSSNPDLSGWPVWVNSGTFTNDATHPHVLNGGWQALIWDPEFGDRDYWRIEPSGRFYLWRGLEEDAALGTSPESARLHMDFVQAVLRVAEALVVVLRFARAMGFQDEATRVAFAFRWRGLADRQLASTNPARRLSVRRVAHQDEVISEVEIPLTVADSAVGPFVSKAVAPLFVVFDGWTVPDSVVEDLTRRLVERRSIE